MEDQGTTWVVAADGAQMRVFEERARAGELRELPAESMRIEGGDRQQAGPHSTTVHERGGLGRHGAHEHKPSQEAEVRFLARVVEHLHAAAQRNAFDRLVLIAPPTALGALRAKLTPQLSARIEASDAHERITDDAEAMRAHLRQVRAKAKA